MGIVLERKGVLRKGRAGEEGLGDVCEHCVFSCCLKVCLERAMQRAESSGAMARSDDNLESFKKRCACVCVCVCVCV